MRVISCGWTMIGDKDKGGDSRRESWPERK